jgi:hypothetical protein
MYYCDLFYVQSKYFYGTNNFLYRIYLSLKKVLKLLLYSSDCPYILSDNLIYPLLFSPKAPLRFYWRRFLAAFTLQIYYTNPQNQTAALQNFSSTLSPLFYPQPTTLFSALPYFAAAYVAKNFNNRIFGHGLAGL